MFNQCITSSQSGSTPIDSGQNNSAVFTENEFATWRTLQIDDESYAVLKGKEGTSNKNVTAWKRSHPFSNSEENEAQAKHQNEPI